MRWTHAIVQHRAPNIRRTTSILLKTLSQIRMLGRQLIARNKHTRIPRNTVAVIQILLTSASLNQRYQLRMAPRSYLLALRMKLKQGRPSVLSMLRDSRIYARSYLHLTTELLATKLAHLLRCALKTAQPAVIARIPRDEVSYRRNVECLVRLALESLVGTVREHLP
jgi:hypothetical protein